MEQKSFLIFKLNQYRYGVETPAVQEIFLLPELTLVEAAPDDIVGVLNLRGNILPVMDLSLRFGHQSTRYQITDSVIVLEWQGLRVGIIVSYRTKTTRLIALLKIPLFHFYLFSIDIKFIFNTLQYCGYILFKLKHKNFLIHREDKE